MDVNSDMMRSGGFCEPRFGTQRTPSRKTLGPRIAEAAEALGKPLLPHQRHIVDVALEIDPDTGQPAYRLVIIILPRQNGKTELLLPVMTHRAIGFPRAQRILYTAQTGSEARKKWEDVHLKRLLDSAFAPLFTARLRLNAESIIWSNGSMWSPIATTKKTSGTGDTLDLGVIDEAWSLPDNGVELAMRPAMQTRPEAQLWLTSMIPGLVRAKTVDSKYLRERQRLGRDCVKNHVTDGIAYFEWSAEEGADPGAPATWRTCMPALGYTISERVVASDFQGTDLADFEAEYLGWWPKDRAPSWVVVRQDTWEIELFDPRSAPAGRVALGVAAPEDRVRAWIGAVGRRPDGHYHVEILEPGQEIAFGTPGLDWLRPRVIDICNRNDPSVVVVDPRSPAATEILPLRQNGIEIATLNTLEYAASCGRFFDVTREGVADEDSYVRIRHIGQPELTKAIAGARKLKSPTHGTFTWDRVGSSVDIGPLEAVTLAMFGYDERAPEDYDVLDSIPRSSRQCPVCEAYPEHPDWPIAHRPQCTVG